MTGPGIGIREGGYSNVPLGSFGGNLLQDRHHKGIILLREQGLEPAHRRRDLYSQSWARYCGTTKSILGYCSLAARREHPTSMVVPSMFRGGALYHG
jgi:hypothetical protein